MGGSRIKFTVDWTRLNTAIDRYAKVVGDSKNRRDIVRGQLKFALKALIDLTPPDTLAQGRKAVKRDLERAVKPYGGEDGKFKKVENDKLRARLVGMLKNENYDGLKKTFAEIGKDGAYGGFVMKDFSPSLHHSVQNGKGRVVSDQQVVTPQVRAWKDYLKSLQNNVGRARGGWAESAMALGLNVQSWIARHAIGGVFREGIKNDKIVIEMINRTILIPGYQKKVNMALWGREKAMLGDMKRFLAGAKTYAGL